MLIMLEVIALLVHPLLDSLTFMIIFFSLVGNSYMLDMFLTYLGPVLFMSILQAWNGKQWKEVGESL